MIILCPKGCAVLLRCFCWVFMQHISYFIAPILFEDILLLGVLYFKMQRHSPIQRITFSFDGKYYKVITYIRRHSTPLVTCTLPCITFNTSLDDRFPIIIRKSGNWSVFWVRMVCATTLPKCLLHIVRNLKWDKIQS